MNIVVAMEDDYLEIMEVWEASVRATHEFLTERDIRFFRSVILSEYLPTVTLHCVKDGVGRIHGFVGVVEQAVEMLFLAPQSRGKGLGKMLLNFAIAEFGARKLDVNEQNPGAVGFYEHMGFKVVSRSPVDATGKPFPLLHMEL
ncbi:GNAT family N-acetyltransferase [Pseudodesulfovibrio sp. S3]|nr:MULTISPECIES: GNAT family N-acetyltransferase [unclassified Pseudodesulfovibrio]MCJ2165618.1 GNAT family N-acetyltransferase [Pseudodesulfovibrio sp. S3-i]RWU03026.1 GNAT family N-acetyltransferase [Pseudodesulfovibrio sp. S3]